MPVIERYRIRAFEEKETREVYEILVPTGAVFLNKVKILHDGIYAFYSVSEIIDTSTIVDSYKILSPKDHIPDSKHYILVDILDIIFEVPPEQQQEGAEPTQGMMLFAVY